MTAALPSRTAEKRVALGYARMRGRCLEWAVQAMVADLEQLAAPDGGSQIECPMRQQASADSQTLPLMPAKHRPLPVWIETPRSAEIEGGLTINARGT
jgi:hypothetical protein